MKFGSLMRRLTPYNIKKGFLFLRHYGIQGFVVKLTERLEEGDVDYQEWRKKRKLTEQERKAQKESVWKEPVIISVVVPIYRTPEEYLRQMIESVLAQTYPHWELCIADGSTDGGRCGKIVQEYAARDSRIRYQALEENLGIAQNTNAAMKMAEGEFLALFDHDDLLAENALYEVALAIASKDGVDMVYTDEDKVTSDLKEYFQPHFKPDFSPDLLRSNNYICHLLAVRRALAEQVGGMRPEFDGAQDHDFIFRCSEQARAIVHVPKILYHWRIHKASTADNPISKQYAVAAGKRAVEGNLKRLGLKGTVEPLKDMGFYRVTYQVQGNPLVSIVIPNKDEKETLKRCLDSIREVTTYENYEILIVENNSATREIWDYYREIENKNGIRILEWKKPFNYSAINNFGISHAKGEYIICLNNDITVITPDWIQKLLANCQRPEVGITGARLYFPDNTIQHAGIVLGIGGVAGSMFVGMDRRRTGYMHKAVIQQDMSAVTAACMMIRKDVWKQAGGFEEKLAVAFNDVDLCLKVRELGLLVVYNPDVEMYHYESKTRGPEDTEEKRRRFQTEIEYMRAHWIKYLKDGDPYYNSNLSLKQWDYSIRP